ncbi:hypothetical protein [uncultured Methanobrevibacter sp.]|uniref:hypothetical protein n=1 Tax=uncultured Methanobrevibacter sp. TaxID=253161 RepID=UPI0026092E85|nr:hypothetical protein [uncultured Methanobrevibacter sp.]
MVKYNASVGNYFTIEIKWYIGKPSATSISTLTWNVKITEAVLIEIDVFTVSELSYFAMTNCNWV